ncbi:hypothetical protein NE237_018734 [Protea cynaroides]|uniref:Uncharacterized protein n=1 Tax=Protea cynaroides TaxID=273540 RepID=A0A9Q0QPA4_9MAGN|nr:hypothetical protein NE237_018734 [Protea cynaroides]
MDFANSLQVILEQSDHITSGGVDDGFTTAKEWPILGAEQGEILNKEGIGSTQPHPPDRKERGSKVTTIDRTDFVLPFWSWCINPSPSYSNVIPAQLDAS